MKCLDVMMDYDWEQLCIGEIPWWLSTFEAETALREQEDIYIPSGKDSISCAGGKPFRVCSCRMGWPGGTHLFKMCVPQKEIWFVLAFYFNQKRKAIWIFLVEPLCIFR